MNFQAGTDSELVDRFVESWGTLDDLWSFDDLDPVASELKCAPPDADGGFPWRPRKFQTPRTALLSIYGCLPAPFPPLFELLVLTYRWAKVDLARFSLLANPPGPNLSRLEAEIHNDRGLADCLHSNGFIHFGGAPGGGYDPVCFDARRKLPDGDCRIVRLDHEEILCRSRIREIAEVAPSFQGLALLTIEEAGKFPSRSAPQNS